MGHRYRTDPSFGDACNAAPFMLRTGEERKPDLQGDLQAQAWHAGSPGVQGRQGRLDRLGKKAGHGRAGWQASQASLQGSGHLSFVRQRSSNNHTLLPSLPCTPSPLACRSGHQGPGAPERTTAPTQPRRRSRSEQRRHVPVGPLPPTVLGCDQGPRAAHHIHYAQSGCVSAQLAAAGTTAANCGITDGA